MKYPRPPPKPDEVRVGQRNLATKRDFYGDAAEKDFRGQLGGDAREAFRMRSRERRDPGYTARQARVLDGDLERQLGLRERANAGLLKKSIDYWGDGPTSQPPTPKPPKPPGGGKPPPTTPKQPPTTPPQSAEGGGALADVPWRKRRVAPQGMVRAQPGELSKLLGI